MSRLDALSRKASQVLKDPVLQRWLVGRAFGRWAGPPAFVAGVPPYLAGESLSLPEGFDTALPEMAEAEPPAMPITLRLPGIELPVHPDQVDAVVGRSFADTETLLGLHRFAWLPLMPDVPPAWVAMFWRAWVARFGAPDDSWAWHPYTAAERAINLLAFARRLGLPGPRAQTLVLLARHAVEIARRLEYFGPHYTGNHLANNGRGLFLIGLALGWKACADMGGRILLEEAKRIFRPSGVLSEGSSHYHVLLTRGYASAWLAARRHGRAETAEFEAVVHRACSVVPRLLLSGGLPLVGDISPDCPPEHLAGLLPDRDMDSGWVSLLDDEDKTALRALRDGLAPVDAKMLARDGWLSVKSAPWEALTYLSPEGWAPMPGHGHQDMGAAEIHWCGAPLFIDPGRGAYGTEGDAAHYVSAVVHGGLSLDDADPYPPNRPYYHPDFRRLVGGEPPLLEATECGMRLVYGGYRRLGAPFVERCWRFSRQGFTITDTVDGSSRRRVTRRLVTPWPVSVQGQVAMVSAPAGMVRVQADGLVPVVRPMTRWTAYGRGEMASAIEFTTPASRLPWSGTLRVEAD